MTVSCADNPLLAVTWAVPTPVVMMVEVAMPFSVVTGDEMTAPKSLVIVTRVPSAT